MVYKKKWVKDSLSFLQQSLQKEEWFFLWSSPFRVEKSVAWSKTHLNYWKILLRHTLDRVKSVRIKKELCLRDRASSDIGSNIIQLDYWLDASWYNFFFKADSVSKEILVSWQFFLKKNSAAMSKSRFSNCKKTLKIYCSKYQKSDLSAFPWLTTNQMGIYNHLVMFVTQKRTVLF